MNITDVPFIQTVFGKRLQAPLAQQRVAPPTTRTGSGTPAVWRPPSVEAPPNAALAVSMQIRSSTQLEENTLTNAGTGAGRESFPFTTTFPGKGNYFLLGGLALALVLAYMWDKGKL